MKHMEKRTVICVVNVGDDVSSSQGAGTVPQDLRDAPHQSRAALDHCRPPRGQHLHLYVTSRLRESESIACKGSPPKRDGRAS